jgi:GntR family transcriptional regulator
VAYGVSRITVRRALDALLNAGLISRRRCVGTLVAEPQERVKSLTLVGSMGELFANAKELSYRVLSRGALDADAWLQQALELGAGRRAHRLELINLNGLLPFAYSEFFYDEALGGRIRDEDLARAEPILALVEDRAQVRFTRAVQTIEPALAGAIAAEHLEIDPGSALLRVVRTYFTSDDRPVQVQVMQCHPVHYRYTSRSSAVTTGSARRQNQAPRTSVHSRSRCDRQGRRHREHCRCQGEAAALDRDR